MTALANRVEQLEASSTSQNEEIATLRAAINTLSQPSNGHSVTTGTITPLQPARPPYPATQSTGLVRPASPRERLAGGASFGPPAPASPVNVAFSPTSPYSSYIPMPPPLTRANTFNDFSSSALPNTPLNQALVEGAVPQPSPGLGDRYGGSDPFDFAAGGAINAGPGMGFFPGGMLSASPGTTNPRRSRIRSASEGLRIQPHRPRGASFSAIAPIVAQAKWMAQQQPVVAGGPLGLPGPVPPPEHINYRALVEHDMEIDADVSGALPARVCRSELSCLGLWAVVRAADPDAQRPAVLDVPPAAAQDYSPRGAQNGHHPGRRTDAARPVPEQVWQLPRLALPRAGRARPRRQLGERPEGTPARPLARPVRVPLRPEAARLW